MNKLNQKLTRTRGLNRIQPREMSVATFALALTLGASTLAAPQRADAQIVELATGALNALFNRPPKQIPNRNLAFGTNNFNSNNFNLCLFPCTPGVGSSSVRLPVPQAVRPTLPPTGMIPSQRSFSSSTAINSQVGTIPPGAIPRTVPPQVVQPRPPRPTVIIPPIKLPINLPL